MAIPWWLAAGEEQCAACEGSYAYEIEVRCIDCDEPMCPVCATWLERRSYCRGCAERGGQRRNGSARRAR